ncbi:merR regulatory family protein [Sphingomonas sp. S17]|jgi:chromosome partitioning protein|uniref:ParA protein n=1 Tax=Sphingomonas paucimobilis NBRC 13935 TaxID=1219050 RepID=A0A0C9N4Z8_SPHPI|nr:MULTISPECIES: AAA family ATPase [Sphingomonas]EGI53604.1 merR regulatory family protein [Sphingomonas sp. S17]QPS14845.1 AAA family ATPase [Sphingomonas paucimobilis]GAN14634.1 chromosome partitioning protein ParA [Sphingomonas paucimobilis NBRC 13935]SUK04206.1 Sporulation initiation inhibitor protein soj [Sphingomonas paucimobilis]
MATAIARVRPDQTRISALAERCSNILEKLRDGAQSKRADERREPIFTIGKAADLVGRTPAAIREAEKDGRLPEPGRTETNRRVGYTLAQLNDMRGVFGTRPWRAADDRCAIVAVQNFKGGVGKSTISVHLAQFLAIRGYRVLLIDCDSQASATTLFGYVPDLDLQEEDTLYPFLRQDELGSLEYAIRATHFDGLDLIPANLRLFQSEYELAARMARGQGTLLDRLQQGIASVADRYDVVVIDPPPALGAISLSVLRAANALVVPVPPTVMDFSSTAAYLAMLDETMQVLLDHGMNTDLAFLRFVASKVDENKSMQRELMGLMGQLFGNALVRTPLKDSAEIDNASARLMTVYELEGPTTSRSVRDRCLTYLDGVNSEIETDIRSMWPSHEGRLRREGLA